MKALRIKVPLLALLVVVAVGMFAPSNIPRVYASPATLTIDPNSTATNDATIGGAGCTGTPANTCTFTSQFAVGIVITGVSTLDLIDDVYGFEISLSYDTAVLTARGITTSTVQAGSQTTHNWQSFLNTGTGFSVTTVDDTAGIVTYALTLLATAGPPRDITASVILARFHFEIDAATVGTSITLMNVILANDEAIQITRSTKESVIYSADGDFFWDTGEPVLNGVAPPATATLADDPKVKFVDSDGDGAYDPPMGVPTLTGSGEPVVYDTNDNGIYDAGEPNIFRLPGVDSSLLDDPKIIFRDNNPLGDGWTVGGFIDLGASVTEIITNNPPVASFTFSPAMPAPDPTDMLTTITFDLSGSTDVEDDTAGTPLGLFMDFGDGLGEQDVTTLSGWDGSTETLMYDLPCDPAAAPCVFDVTLRVVDSAGATGLARDPASGTPIVDNQPSHTTQTITIEAPVMNQNPTIDAGADEVVDEGTTLNHLVTASDPDLPPQTLTFSLSGNAATAGATIDSSTGTVTWVTGEEDGPGVYTATVTVDDGAGGSATDSFMIMVNEVNLNPTIDAGADETLSEGATLTHPVTASDPDIPANTLSYSLSGSAATAGATISSMTGTVTWVTDEADGPGVYTATVTVSDGLGGSAMDSFMITVSEVNQNPIVDAGADEMVNEGTTLTHATSASDPDLPPNTLAFSVSGSAATAGAVIDSATGVVTWAIGEEDGPGLYNTIVTVTDGAGGTASDEFMITVSEVNLPPEIDVPGPQQAVVGTTLSFFVSATDADIPANMLTFSADGLVTGMNFDPATREFTFTPTGAQNGQTFIVSFTVADNGTPQLSDTEQVSITVVTENVAPVLAMIMTPQMIDELDTLSFQAQATDANNDPLTFSCTGCEAIGATITAGGFFSFTPTEAQGPGSFTVTIIVTDTGGLSDSQQVTINVNEVNVAPAVNAGADEILDEGMTLTHPTTAIDTDEPPQTLTFSLSGSAATAGAVISSMTGVVTWAIGEEDGPGVYTATVTVDDGAGGTATDSFMITVNEVNQNPTINAGADETLNEGQTLTHPVTASDPDIPANTLSYILSGSASAAGATIDSSTGTVTWVTDESDGPGTYTATVTVSDGVGGSAQDSFTIAVNEVNQVPSVDAGPDETIDEGQTLTHPTSASDPDLPPQTLAFSLSGSAATAGAAIDPVTGVVTWVTGEEDGPGVYEATVTATDSFSGAFSDTFMVTVNEVNSAPTASFGLSANANDNEVTDNEPFTLTDTSVDPDTPANLATVTVDWGDTSPIENIAPGGSANHAYTSFGSFTITLSATDTGGLFDTETRTMMVVNHDPVAVITAPSQGFTGISVTFDGSGSSDPDSAFGDTITNFSWDFGDTTTGSGPVVQHVYASAGTFTVTLTVTDNHGATGTATVQIEIVPPNISGALVRGKASPLKHHQDLSDTRNNVFRAVGKNTGPITAFFYVRFDVMRDDGATFGPVFTSVVQLQPGEIIVGRTNPLFQAIFPTAAGADGMIGTADDPGPGGYTVTATIFASVDNMVSSGDTPDLASQKTFSFSAVQ